MEEIRGTRSGSHNIIAKKEKQLLIGKIKIQPNTKDRLRHGSSSNTTTQIETYTHAPSFFAKFHTNEMPDKPLVVAIGIICQELIGLLIPFCLIFRRIGFHIPIQEKCQEIIVLRRQLGILKTEAQQMFVFNAPAIQLIIQHVSCRLHFVLECRYSRRVHASEICGQCFILFGPEEDMPQLDRCQRNIVLIFQSQQVILDFRHLFVVAFKELLKEISPALGNLLRLRLLDFILNLREGWKGRRKQ